MRGNGMGTLGSYLRTVREARNIDLREAAQQTRISINYLKAIEEEDFSKLPGEVFVKGFLKNYARFLQLPEDEVVRRYAELSRPSKSTAPAPAPTAAAPTAAAPKPAPAPEQQAAPVRERRPSRNLEPYIWAAVALTALAALILTTLPGQHAPRKQEDSPASHSIPTATAPAAPMPAPRAEKLYLDIVALEDVWVLVRTDASPQKKAILKKGERVTWSADERFLLSYAGLGNVELILNGNLLTVKGPKNAVVRDLVITSAGIAYQKVESEQPAAPRKPKPVTLPTPTPQLPSQPQQQPQQQPAPETAEPAPAAPSEQQPAPLVSPIFSQ